MRCRIFEKPKSKIAAGYTSALPVVIAICLMAGPNQTTARGEENLPAREAELLAEFKKSPSGENLLPLARVREDQGKFEQAIATWRLAKKLWGTKQIPRHSTAPTQSWAATADFFVHRLQRKINLRARAPQPNRLLYPRLEQALSSFRGNPPVDQLDFAVQADLDGDFVDELFYIGSHGPLGKRTRKSMGIAQWDGWQYRVVWRIQQDIPFMVHVTDRDGDGWKEIFCGYQPDSDDAATLYFNGKTALFL